MTVGEGVAVVATIVGGLAWLFRLEGRVTSHEQVCAERQKNLLERHDRVQRELADMNGSIKALVQHVMAKHS